MKSLGWEIALLVAVLVLVFCIARPPVPVYYILNMTDASVFATHDRAEAQRWVDSDEGIVIDANARRRLNGESYPDSDVPGAR